ncbi:MAG: ribokinase [Clostridia bacterium]|nr:ribokinase [Clostridia bacterium]
MRVLNFGSLNLDYVYQVDHFVRPGETLSSTSRAVKLGGKGLNQSIALARAGANVSHAGCIGAGGEALKAQLERDGVDVSMLLSVDEMQGHTVIQVNRDGENCILLYGGSNQCVTEKQIADTFARCAAGDWLVLQNEVNNLPAIVDAAYAKGMVIALNPSPYDARLEAVDFGKLSWLLVNEVEAGQISGSDDPAAAWTWLHGRYPRLNVLITLGSAGSAAYRVDGGAVETVTQEAFRVKAVDTTAAGDTFTGYFIAGLMAGMPLKECMRRASKASSLSVTRLGAADSIPALSEVE